MQALPAICDTSLPMVLTCRSGDSSRAHHMMQRSEEHEFQINAKRTDNANTSMKTFEPVACIWSPVPVTW